jgi:cell division protein FtsW (lipid II flippase)
MINTGNSMAGFIISIIALIHGLVACFISAIIFIALVYHLYKDRMKRVNKITFILCANIYLLIFVYSATLISLNIHSILL